MCGIAGIFDPTANKSQLEHYLSVMGDLISHRGPDDSGQWVHPNENLGMAHRRLSVIDLSPNAKQPMTDGQNNWIVFNGEIYNYKELMAQLGYKKIRTVSDTGSYFTVLSEMGKRLLKQI